MQGKRTLYLAGKITGDPYYFTKFYNYHFTCSDCACSGCAHLHNCDAQCDLRKEVDSGAACIPDGDPG